MKYVMLRKIYGNGGAGLHQFIPVIFPDQLVHAEVVQALQAMPDFADAKPVSAGEVQLDVMACAGRSATLELRTHADDQKIINSMNYAHGLGFNRRAPHKKKMTT